MTAIRIRRHIDSETLHLPELKAFLGQDVDILVTAESSKPPVTEKDWEDLFTNAGSELIEPPKQRPGPGLCKGMITIVSDDEDHLKDFEEYM